MFTGLKDIKTLIYETFSFKKLNAIKTLIYLLGELTAIFCYMRFLTFIPKPTTTTKKTQKQLSFSKSILRMVLCLSL